MENVAVATSPTDRSSGSERYYVVDDACNVVLHGTTPNDLVPAGAQDARMPLDVDRAVRRVVQADDFGSGFARAATGSKSLRVLLLSGPSGTFYGVVARERTNVMRSRAS